MAEIEDFDARESEIPRPMPEPVTKSELQQEIVQQKYDKIQQRKAEHVGKQTSLVFALICSLFLGYQCWSYDKRGEQIPVLTWLPTLCLIGGGLGVSIDAGMIGKFFVRD